MEMRHGSWPVAQKITLAGTLNIFDLRAVGLYTDDPSDIPVADDYDPLLVTLKPENNTVQIGKIGISRPIGSAEKVVTQSFGTLKYEYSHGVGSMLNRQAA